MAWLHCIALQTTNVMLWPKISTKQIWYKIRFCTFISEVARPETFPSQPSNSVYMPTYSSKRFIWQNNNKWEELKKNVFTIQYYPYNFQAFDSFTEILFADSNRVKRVPPPPTPNPSSSWTIKKVHWLASNFHVENNQLVFSLKNFISSFGREQNHC